MYKYRVIFMVILALFLQTKSVTAQEVEEWSAKFEEWAYHKPTYVDFLGMVISGDLGQEQAVNFLRSEHAKQLLSIDGTKITESFIEKLIEWIWEYFKEGADIQRIPTFPGTQAVECGAIIPVPLRFHLEDSEAVGLTKGTPAEANADGEKFAQRGKNQRRAEEYFNNYAAALCKSFSCERDCTKNCIGPKKPIRISGWGRYVNLWGIVHLKVHALYESQITIKCED